MKFDVKFDLKGLQRSLNDLQRKVVPKVAARALNRAIESTATAAAREISAATKIPVRDVRKRLQVRKASTSRLVAELRAYGYAPNLSKFRPTQRREGVAATAWERRKVYRHAFILPSGRVVTRTTNKRAPLKSLLGPSVRGTFMTERVQSRMQAVARQTWRSEFERQIARELRG